MRRLHAAMWSLSMMACGSSPSPSDAGNAPMDGALDASTTDAGEAPQCPAGQTFCEGACVTLETDREHCGECGRRCPMGEVCSASACGLDCSAPAVPCEDGDADYCADLSSDEANCGACGRRCELGLTCLVGDCALVCPEGTVDCDGRCADLNSDSQHCGSCANSCNRDHAVGVCRDRACALTCETGYGDCDLSIDNGCETDLVNSTAHCRSCGVSCAEPHVAESRCSAAGCVIESCESGFADCNAMAIDGCEADLGSSSSCGACGRTCDARYPCSAAGECLAVPVAGAVALPSCGFTSTSVAAMAIDPLTNDVLLLLRETSPSGQRACTARGPGGRDFVVAPVSPPAPYLNFWPDGPLFATGPMIALVGSAVLIWSNDGGASFTVEDERPYTGATSPTAIVAISPTPAPSYATRIGLDGSRMPIVLPALPTTGERFVSWERETGNFWLTAAHDGGTDILRSTDDGRTFTLVGSLTESLEMIPTHGSNWSGPTVSGGYLYGIHYGPTGAERSLLRVPVGAPSSAPEVVADTLGCAGCLFEGRLRPAWGDGVVALGRTTVSSYFRVTETAIASIPGPGSHVGAFRFTPAVAVVDNSTRQVVVLSF